MDNAQSYPQAGECRKAPCGHPYALVAVDVPYPQPVAYRIPEGMAPEAGMRCIVPWGPRRLVGIVVGTAAECGIPDSKVRELEAVLDDVPRLSAEWLALTRFAADYYGCAWGQAALCAVPRLLKSQPRARYALSLSRALSWNPARSRPAKPTEAPQLSAAQLDAATAIAGSGGFHVTALYGVTGSGKTEVYLECIRRTLESDPQAQVLVLVPEINLVPQIEKLVRGRFPAEGIAAMNSSMPDARRVASWLAAAQGTARILIGTRMAVWMPAAHLRLIVVDEEHEGSYKADDGFRYSARVLAVKRAQLESLPVVLGSATPSLETWAKVRAGSYGLARLPQRAAGSAVLPRLVLADVRRRRQPGELFSPEAAEAVTQALGRGEQVLVFINRRGYAPVLTCPTCGWTSGCPNCSVHSVFHKNTGRLVCHRCGWSARVPAACPQCSDPDIRPVGHGTQRIEETIARMWPQARVLRIDADTTRTKGSAEAAFAKVHEGDVDILVGTQMVAKGHDFRRIKLVVVLSADGLLVSPDFRATERLFAQLIQVAGRAGRHGTQGTVLIQTEYPTHPMFEAIARGDWERYADVLLRERQAASMPPFSAQALLRAEAKSFEQAEEFLAEAARQAPEGMPATLFDPVPAGVQRVKGLERAQILVEADAKAALQRFLRAWMPRVRTIQSRCDWYIEVDPSGL